jgi:hypothetical protein
MFALTELILIFEHRHTFTSKSKLFEIVHIHPDRHISYVYQMGRTN